MSLRAYLFAMFLGTILCFISFGFVIKYVNPFESGWLGLVLFYASLFFGLVGLLSMMIFFVRRRLVNNEVLYANVGIAFRQAILLSLILCVNLVLFQVDELTIFKGTVVSVVIGLIEVLFHYFNK